MNTLITLLTIVHPFLSDGCTNFPDGTRNNPLLWRECCFEHDLHFWAGGSREARNRADLRLRECVREKGESFMAEIMYLGIRVGSYSPRKIKGKEWGNAWEKPGYGKLTPNQVLEIKSEIPKLTLPVEIEARFIESLEKDSK